MLLIVSVRLFRTVLSRLIQRQLLMPRSHVVLSLGLLFVTLSAPCSVSSLASRPLNYSNVCDSRRDNEIHGRNSATVQWIGHINDVTSNDCSIS